MEGGGERLQRLVRVDSLPVQGPNLMHRTRATLTLVGFKVHACFTITTTTERCWLALVSRLCSTVVLDASPIPGQGWLGVARSVVTMGCCAPAVNQVDPRKVHTRSATPLADEKHATQIRARPTEVKGLLVSVVIEYEGDTGLTSRCVPSCQRRCLAH